ncbi:uncharacterized protein LOC125230505 isoform X1 [Leguminivora glycinivorella]|uniref:uncharacterized protein LOC125230505 isoform X1 n=1 Tax=Leguminivora glycinivorella TaxID=1035111 RepID=UPI00200FED4A|nr:uncharacterized protein LOC125230505 isoform X1 [Leguminivora glycinivorella]
MLRLTVLVIALTAVLADKDDMKKCMRLLHTGSMRCCKKEIPMPKIDREELKECFKIPHSPHSCEPDICIGKKRGYASDDGTVDMDAFEKAVTEDFSSSPTLMEAIKEKCVKGDVSKYGPPDACQLAKLKLCLHNTMILDCKEWSDDGPCAGIKGLVMECAKE